MKSYNRSHTCGEINYNHRGKSVRLAGWVHRRRDHGGLIFIDLRDKFGLTQLVFNPQKAPIAHENASTLRSEWVICVEGIVMERAVGMHNPHLATGQIEIEVEKLRILSKSNIPPFSIADDRIDVSEELRLKYRYLDMRRGDILRRLKIRHDLMLQVRNHLSGDGFIEVTTPILAKSTPEGARDYLVPSRVHPGTFYALPQSPQIFKQLLMVGGVDRYFQIASCFRDEDLRSDRQPEFTQIDMEMSFATQNELFPIVENLMAQLFKTTLGIDIVRPFRRMSHAQALQLYGTDKPDLRFEMPLFSLSDLLSSVVFDPLRRALELKEVARGLCVKGGKDLSRKSIESLQTLVTQFGVSGLTWIKIDSTSFSSNLAKHLDKATVDALASRCGAQADDLILFVVGKEKCTHQALDHLRRHLAKERGLIDKNRFELLWITDFPLFQWDEETKSIVAEHHPFTSPHLEDLELLKTAPLKARSSSYDLVLNGYELASGSQRIHDSALQSEVFRLLNLSEEALKSRFGFFIEALSYGTPPHLGIALGFDRIVMILSATESMRDVIAFPKTQKATDLMSEAPSEVLVSQLKELSIKIDKN